MRPAGPAASRPDVALHLRGSPARWLRWSSFAPLWVQQRQDRETLGRGGALGVEPDDGVAYQPGFRDVVGVVFAHFLGVDAELHRARDGPVGGDRDDAPGELGPRIGPDMVHQLCVARDLCVVGPRAGLTPGRPVVV